MQKNIEPFKTIIKQLLDKHLALKKENKTLQSKIIAQHLELTQARKTIEELKNDINHLHIARSVATTFEEKKATKEQLNKMVREIDKCLALLTE